MVLIVIFVYITIYIAFSQLVLSYIYFFLLSSPSKGCLEESLFSDKPAHCTFVVICRMYLIFEMYVCNKEIVYLSIYSHSFQGYRKRSKSLPIILKLTRIAIRRWWGDHPSRLLFSVVFGQVYFSHHYVCVCVNSIDFHRLLKLLNFIVVVPM
jgi:hypothetical protein